MVGQHKTLPASGGGQGAGVTDCSFTVTLGILLAGHSRQEGKEGMDLRQRGVVLAVGFLVGAAALGCVVMVAGPAWASSPALPSNVQSTTFPTKPDALPTRPRPTPTPRPTPAPRPTRPPKHVPAPPPPL